MTLPRAHKFIAPNGDSNNNTNNDTHRRTLDGMSLAFIALDSTFMAAGLPLAQQEE